MDLCLRSALLFCCIVFTTAVILFMSVSARQTIAIGPTGVLQSGNELCHWPQMGATLDGWIRFERVWTRVTWAIESDSLLAKDVRCVSPCQDDKRRHYSGNSLSLSRAKARTDCLNSSPLVRTWTWPEHNSVNGHTSAIART